MEYRYPNAMIAISVPPRAKIPGRVAFGNVNMIFSILTMRKQMTRVLWQIRNEVELKIVDKLFGIFKSKHGKSKYSPKKAIVATVTIISNLFSFFIVITFQRMICPIAARISRTLIKYGR